MAKDSDGSDIPVDAQHADDIALPNDAAERKRVLNILAQRRYRMQTIWDVEGYTLIVSGRRRRERQQALENLVGLSKSIGRARETTHHSNEQATSNGSPNSSPTDSNTISNGDTTASSISTDRETSDTNTSSTALAPPLIDWPFDYDSSWLEGTTTNYNRIHHFPSCSDSGAENDFSAFLQTDDIQNATFADDFNIAVPELDLLRAAYENAGRMNSSHLLFSGLTAQSVFQTTDCSSWVLTLPSNLVPTDTQLTTPHHPAIDVLPWPAVRNRLIKMYAMPSEIWPRHPSDGTQSSLVRFIYDMEDGGVRVTGQDPAAESAWEIDQRFFENWWWALDQVIVANTNLKRSARGQRMLCAPSHGVS